MTSNILNEMIPISPNITIMVNYDVDTCLIPEHFYQIRHTSKEILQSIVTMLNKNMLQTPNATVKNIITHHCLKQKRFNDCDYIRCNFVVNKRIIYHFFVAYDTQVVTLTEFHIKQNKSKPKKKVWWYEFF